MRFLLLLALPLVAQTRLAPDQVTWVPGLFESTQGTRVHGGQISVWGMTGSDLDAKSCRFVDYQGEERAYRPNPWLFEHSLLFLYVRGGGPYPYAPEDALVPAQRCSDGEMWGDSPLSPQAFGDVTPCVSTAVSPLQIRPIFWDSECAVPWS